MYWQTFFLAILAVHHVFGDYDTKLCHTIPLLDTFDINGVMGLWNVQLTTYKLDGNRTAVTYNLILGERDHSNVTITLEKKWLQTNTEIVKYMNMYQVNNTSEFRIEWNGALRRSWIIATDYNTFSTWFLCIPTEKNGGLIFITTREANPNSTTVETAYKSVENVGFHMKEAALYTVRHQRN